MIRAVLFAGLMFVGALVFGDREPPPEDLAGICSPMCQLTCGNNINCCLHCHL